MTDTCRLGPWLRRFLEEHLASERKLARNTQLSYRDTFALLLPFASDRARKPVDRLAVRDLGPDLMRDFLGHLEQERGCSPQTRNQRLAAIRSFARYVAGRSPTHVEWCGQIRGIPLKNAAPPPVGYLEKPAIDALLKAPDPTTLQGRREFAVLLFLYNSGARASEAAGLRVGDLQAPEAAPHPGPTIVTLRGKGGKTRRCPLWPRTARALSPLVAGRARDEPVFLNRRGRPLTRSGISQLVGRCARRAAERAPTLVSKRVSAHSLRHSCATHLLRSGVDINTIRAWLGHAKIDTTAVYAEIDMEAKARAAKLSDSGEAGPSKPWSQDKGLMAFLSSL